MRPSFSSRKNSKLYRNLNLKRKMIHLAIGFFFFFTTNSIKLFLLTKKLFWTLCDTFPRVRRTSIIHEIIKDRFKKKKINFYFSYCAFTKIFVSQCYLGSAVIVAGFRFRCSNFFFISIIPHRLKAFFFSPGTSCSVSQV